MEGSLDVAIGDDGALWGSSFIRGEVGRSQAALQEGKVEALRGTTFQVILLKEQRGQAYTFAHCSAQEPAAEKSALCPSYSQKTLS